MGNKTETLHVRLNKEQAITFKKKAKKEGMTRSELVRIWIEEYVQCDKKEKLEFPNKE